MRKIISRVIEFVFQAKTPYTWNLGRSGGMVYAHDSKSCLERDEGSSPSSGTRQETRSVSDCGLGRAPAPAAPARGGWRAPRGAGGGWRVRFEPKIFWREDFLEGRSLDCAASSNNEASFSHARMGSSQTAALRSSSRIRSCADFFVDINSRLRDKYSSRSISCSTKRSVRRAILPSKSAIFARIA